jgi:hypothetical protein
VSGKPSRVRAVVAPDLMPTEFELWSTPRNVITNYLHQRQQGCVVDARLQQLMETMLREILDGKDPRTVFGEPPSGKAAEKRRRSMAICAEVLRLEGDGVDSGKAKVAVMEAFGSREWTLRRSLKEWRDSLEKRPNFVSNYRNNLRRRGLI